MAKAGVGQGTRRASEEGCLTREAGSAEDGPAEEEFPDALGRAERDEPAAVDFFGVVDSRQGSGHRVFEPAAEAASRTFL